VSFRLTEYKISRPELTASCLFQEEAGFQLLSEDDDDVRHLRLSASPVPKSQYATKP